MHKRLQGQQQGLPAEFNFLGNKADRAYDEGKWRFLNSGKFEITTIVCKRRHISAFDGDCYSRRLL